MWEGKRLGEYVNVNPESITSKDDIDEINYIDISSVASGVLSSYQTIKMSEAPSRAKRKIQKNDFIFSTVRPNLRAYYYVKTTPINAIVSTGFAVIRVKKNCDSRFMYYLITDRSFVDYLTNVAKGTAYPAVDTKDFLRAKISIPSLSTQRKIADILSAYDDLIENNNSRIELLERAAQQIYKEWFVRFRFPGFETSNFTKGIPNGWEMIRLSEVAKIQMGQSPKSEFYNENDQGLPFHQGVSDFNRRYPTHTIYSTDEKRIANNGDILISVRAPVGRINIANCKLVIGRGLCSISSKTNNQCYLYYLLNNYFHKEDIIGNGSIFSSVGKDELFGIKLLLPPKNLIRNFESIVTNIDSQILRLTFENRNLIKQRDLLLPRLMSGKLEV